MLIKFGINVWKNSLHVMLKDFSHCSWSFGECMFTTEHNITNVSQVASLKKQTGETTAADAQLRNLREFMKVRACVQVTGTSIPSDGWHRPVCAWMLMFLPLCVPPTSVINTLKSPHIDGKSRCMFVQAEASVICKTFGSNAFPGSYPKQKNS